MKGAKKHPFVEADPVAFHEALLEGDDASLHIPDFT